MLLINFIRGFCMALADSVPGVSGGTIAFILGFYDAFITALDDLIVGNKAEKSAAARFLLKLGAGWICGLILSVLIITSIFESHIYTICSLFIGFILASIPFIYKEEKQSIHGHYKNIIFSLIGIVVVVLITSLNPLTAGESTVSSSNLFFFLYVFVAGMVAISAMVLPGISGSTLLLIFGLYASIMNAIKEVLTLNFSHLPLLIAFGLGVIAGIFLTIRLVKYCLTHYRSATIYTILGLMVGSIYAIIMGPMALKTSLPPLSFESFSLIAFIIGACLVTGLDMLSEKLASQE